MFHQNKFQSNIQLLNCLKQTKYFITSETNGVVACSDNKHLLKLDKYFDVSHTTFAKIAFIFYFESEIVVFWHEINEDCKYPSGNSLHIQEVKQIQLKDKIFKLQNIILEKWQ